MNICSRNLLVKAGVRMLDITERLVMFAQLISKILILEIITMYGQTV